MCRLVILHECRVARSHGNRVCGQGLQEFGREYGLVCTRASNDSTV